MLAATALLTFSWLAYLAAMASHPEWLIRLWGPDVTWENVEIVWFWAMVAYKLILWFFVLLVLWLTLSGATDAKANASRRLTERLGHGRCTILQLHDRGLIL